MVRSRDTAGYLAPRFNAALEGFRFLPGRRILAGTISLLSGNVSSGLEPD